MSGFLQQHQDLYQQPEETQATTDIQYQNHHEHGQDTAAGTLAIPGILAKEGTL